MKVNELIDALEDLDLGEEDVWVEVPDARVRFRIKGVIFRQRVDVREAKFYTVIVATD